MNEQKDPYSFEMNIEEIFHLSISGGRTVLLGKINNEKRQIHSCRCKLVVDDIEIATIIIESEMMPGIRDPNSPYIGYRSLATPDDIHLTSEDIKLHKCKLICCDNSNCEDG